MSYTQRYSEWFNPLLSEHTDQFAIGTYVSAWASLQNYHRARLVVNVGDMLAGSTFYAQIMQAQDAAGTGAKVIGSKTGFIKATTTLTEANGDQNELLCIELQTEELDIDNGFEFVGAAFYVAGNAVELSCELSAYEPRFAPVPTTNWDEIVD
jgi:hypothetical protein